MTGPTGWRPLRPLNARSPALPPFTRLARTQALLSAGDTLVALALSSSLFFSISPDAARGQIALYLALTMAPFAVVAPLLGPWIDRRQGGRRSMVLLSAGARAGVCLLMMDDVDGLLLFPEALAVLVLGKGYTVARASLVPGLVKDPSELVEANSKLVLVLGLAGFAAAIPGVALLQLGAPFVLAGAALAFAAGAGVAFRIPSTTVAADQAGPDERAELRGAGILLAASAMAVLRGIVGFLSFHLAFWLRTDGAETWWFGVVLASSAVGSLLGAWLAPHLRRLVREERVLLACLAVTTVAALAMLWVGGRGSAAALALLVGVTASAGRLCFDAVVQRDAPLANQGRSFARFETRFQLAWVAGAFVPVLVSIPLGTGYVVVAVAALVAAVSFATGRSLRAAHLRRLVPKRRPRGITQ